MAHISKIRPEPVARIVRGGPTRPSRLVGLQAYPAVAVRQSVNARLLAGLCGHGPGRPTFTADEAAMLSRIARERFGAEHAVLRKRALTGLADVGSMNAFQQLSALVLSPVTDETARATALAALVLAAPALGAGIASLVQADAAPVVRASALKTVDAVMNGPTRKPGRAGKRSVPAVDR